MAGQARPVRERHVELWLVLFRYGRQGKFWQGEARFGKVWQAWQG